MDVKLFVLTFCLSALVTQSQIQLENFGASVTQLSSELYQKCIESNRSNVNISPYSVVNALVLLSQAANGRTLYQLKRCLNFTDIKSNILNNYLAYQQSIQESARNSTFIVANKLYIQKGYQINENFQDMATNQLLSGVEMIDFTNPTEAAKVINNFVAEKTQNKTGDIIKPESLKTDTRIVLMNTIYIKLRWENVYQSFFIEDRGRSFKIYNRDNIVFYMPVEYTIFSFGRFKYADLNEFGAKAIDIKFADSDLSLVLILPVEPKYRPSLPETEAKLRGYDLTKIIDRMQPEKVYVKVPTFQIKYQISGKDLSNQLRISNIFETGKANLSGLLNNDNLTSVSDTILTSVIDVEPGTETEKKIGNFLNELNDLYFIEYARKKRFICTHPFLYHIYDHKLKTAIFSGRLNEFEGEKCKHVSYGIGGTDGEECFNANGTKEACTTNTHYMSMPDM